MMKKSSGDAVSTQATATGITGPTSTGPFVEQQTQALSEPRPIASAAPAVANLPAVVNSPDSQSGEEKIKKRDADTAPFDKLSTPSQPVKRSTSISKISASILPAVVEESGSANSSRHNTLKAKHLEDPEDILSAKNLEKKIVENSSEDESGPVSATKGIVAANKETVSVSK